MDSARGVSQIVVRGVGAAALAAKHVRLNRGHPGNPGCQGEAWQTRVPAIAMACFCMVLGLLFASPAEAHVKWFAQWDIICPPRDPKRVLSSEVWRAFFAAAAVVMAALAALDWHLARSSALERFSSRVHDAVAPRSMPLLRYGLAIYFLLAATCLPQPVYLTPELQAPHWVTVVQLAAAALVLWRQTAWLAGLALIGLYAMAVLDHGWFHLLDYPLFLGLGIILLLPKLIRSDTALLSLDILRASAAITLLWGGIEKFAYPEWSFGLMRSSPFLSLGVAPETAMYMYGFGELALSFGLLAFGVGSQLAAGLLLVIFVVAIVPFGLVDLVGHSGIIVALALLMLTRSRLPLRLGSAARNAACHGAAYSATLVALGVCYFGLHGLYLAPKTTVATAGRSAGDLTVEHALHNEAIKVTMLHADSPLAT